MADQTNPIDVRNKPAGEVLDDMMNQSQQALQSTARAAAELNELRRRADEALDWRTQLNRHSWAAMGLAIGAAALLFLLFARRR
jgi:hypothetical protein